MRICRKLILHNWDFSIFGLSRIGSFFLLSVLLRSFARLRSAISVLGMVHVGSSLSLRSYARLGSSISIFGVSRVGTAVSVLVYVLIGTSLSLRSFARLGSSISYFVFLSEVSHDLARQSRSLTLRIWTLRSRSEAWRGSAPASQCGLLECRLCSSQLFQALGGFSPAKSLESTLSLRGMCPKHASGLSQAVF